MPDDHRVETVKRLLLEHVKSPSLRHIKDPYVIIRLAHDIVKRLDRGNSMWTKMEWSSGATRHSGGSMLDGRCRSTRSPQPHGGPPLTMSDVAQRLRAFEEESYTEFARDEHQASCSAIYEVEKASGTEMPAIVGMLRDHIEREEERQRLELDARIKATREQERIVAEQRLLSGADCKWTSLGKSKDAYCRVNGRLYRLSPTTDNRLDLVRVEAADAQDGVRVGRYQKRGDATKAVAQIAYQLDLMR